MENLDNKNIWFLIPILGVGGAERVTLEITEGLLPSFSKIGIMTNELRGEFVKEVNPNIELGELKTFSPLKSSYFLRQFFNKEKPDIVVAQGTRMCVMSSIAMLFSKHKPHLIWCLHNPYSTKHNIYPEPIAFFITQFVSLLTKMPKRVVGVSDGVCASFLDYVGEKYRYKTLTIHNPIPAFEGEVATSGETKGKKQIIAAGRLAPQKNYDHLIATMPAVLKRVDAELKIYGLGPLKEKLQGQINDLGLENNVFLMGYASDIKQRMANSDVFVLSSLWEGLPTVLIEAMGTGTPVVSTDCVSGPDEILEGGKWGKLVPEHDKQALADAIVDVLTKGGVNPEERAKQFRPESVIQKYLGLFRDVSNETHIARK